MKNIHILPTEKPSRFYSTAPTATKKEGYAFGEHYIPNTRNMFSNHNIYITSDEEIKEGDWYLNIEEKNGIKNPFYGKLYKANPSIKSVNTDYKHNLKKIILTTDQDLIKDGVQAIDDEFLEWFVNNLSCEFVEVEKYHGINTSIAEVNYISGDGSLGWQGKNDLRDYKIIIAQEEPKFEDSIENSLSIMSIANDMFGKKEEPKQETLEEAKKYLSNEGYGKGSNFTLNNVANLMLEWQQEQDNTANEILEYILLNDDGVGIALGYNSREMIEQYFKKINWEIQPEQIWNDEKMELIKKTIKEHKDGKSK